MPNVYLDLQSPPLKRPQRDPQDATTAKRDLGLLGPPSFLSPQYSVRIHLISALLFQRLSIKHGM